MSLSKTVYNEFYQALKYLEHTKQVASVKKTDFNIVTEDEYNCIQVVLGEDVRTEYSPELFQHSLSIYADLHVRYIEEFADPDNNIDDVMLDVRELVERTILQSNNLSLDFIFDIKFIGQSAPDYNEPGAEYKSSTRLEFLITYDAPRQLACEQRKSQI